MYLTNQMFLAEMMSYFNFSSNLNMTKISTKLKTLFLTIETEVQYAIAHIQKKLFCFVFHMLIFSYDDYMVADLTKSNFN